MLFAKRRKRRPGDGEREPFSDWTDWTWTDESYPRIIAPPLERSDVVGKSFWLGIFTTLYLEGLVALLVLGVLFILGIL